MAGAHPGLLAVWNDITPGDEGEFNAWYEEEHFPERLGVPGFLTARRYRDAEAALRYAAFYDTASLAVLTSAAYLERLANPTPRTRAIMPHFRNMARAACEIVADVGSHRAPARALACLEIDATRVAGARESLAVVATVGRVRLAMPDANATQVPNPEAKFRETPDRLPPPFLLVEGNDPGTVAAAAERLARAFGAPRPARLFELLLAHDA